MFSAAKDALTSKAAAQFINARIARYGEVTDLRLDSKRRTVEATCRLKGEPEPISVHVDEYQLDEQGGKTFVQAKGCRCSRTWLQNLLQDFVEGRRIEVPPWAKAAL